MTAGLEDMLRAATVRVEGGPMPGAGFFAAPGIVVTCAHVVGTGGDLAIRWPALDAPPIPAERILILNDRGKPVPALDQGYPDVALLRVNLDGHPCVALDEGWPLEGDRFKIYGFPEEGGSVTLTGSTLTYRAKKAQEPTVFIDLSADTVKPGMSGAALLNLRTRGVCGVMVATRNAASPDGGLAVPWLAFAEEAAVFDLAGLNRSFHRRDARWAQAVRLGRRRIRFRIPRVATDFFGRAWELEQLEQAIGPPGGVRTLVVSGLGGVGKTQLAARFVEANQDDYDVVAWIRAEVNGAADLADLATEVGVESEDLSPEDRSAAALRWLENFDGRWLLVLDNATTPSDVLALSPSAGSGTVLVTSRHHDLERLGFGLGLDVFDDQTAAQYLASQTRRSSDIDGAVRVARALGGLPLALSHAAAYCSPAFGFDDYLQLLERLPAAELFDVSRDIFYAKTVASTWQLSIDAAVAEAELSWGVMQLAGHVAPEAIPVTLFNALLHDRDDVRQRKRLVDALNALERYSLVVLTDRGVNVHRLVQKTIRDEAASRGDSGGGLAALDGLCAEFPDEPLRPGWWPQCEELCPHVLALGRHGTVPSGEDEERVIALLNRALSYLLAAGDGNRAEVAAEEASKRAAKTLGDEHRGYLEARANLATAYLTLGRPSEAIEVLEELRSRSELLFGDDDVDTLRWSTRLATAYDRAGRFGNAITLLEQVLDGMVATVGHDHPETVTTLGHLATAYWAGGRVAEALQLCERVKTQRESLLGPDHPATLLAYGDLAVAYWSAGKTADCIALQEQVVARHTAVLGTDHPETLTVRGNLVGFYRSAGRTDDALTLGEPLLTDTVRVLGTEHPLTLGAQANLAGAYRDVDRFDEAISLFEDVIAAVERILGADHPNAMTTRASLAASYQAAGRTADAISLLERVVSDRKRLVGSDHPEFYADLVDLAKSYCAAGRVTEAVGLLEDVVTHRNRLLGRDHRDTAAAAALLAEYCSIEERQAPFGAADRVAESVLGADP